MEHFRIMLTQQKEALQKDVAENNKQIIELEESLDKVREANKMCNAQLRSITKKLEKL